jgi:hypothetical protein
VWHSDLLPQQRASVVRDRVPLRQLPVLRCERRFHTGGIERIVAPLVIAVIVLVVVTGISPVVLAIATAATVVGGGC